MPQVVIELIKETGPVQPKGQRAWNNAQVGEGYTYNLYEAGDPEVVYYDDLAETGACPLANSRYQALRWGVITARELYGEGVIPGKAEGVELHLSYCEG